MAETVHTAVLPGAGAADRFDGELDLLFGLEAQVKGSGKSTIGRGFLALTTAPFFHWTASTKCKAFWLS